MLNGTKMRVSFFVWLHRNVSLILAGMSIPPKAPLKNTHTSQRQKILSTEKFIPAQ